MPLGRFETWARLGRMQTAETMFDAAAKMVEDRNWRERLKRAPHGDPWHTSFHVSEFPAGDPRACMRKALYEMMGFPLTEPASRMLTGTAIMGDAAEEWNALNLDVDGRVLSVGAIREKKTRFDAADHWLTGSPDFIVIPPFWNRPHLIETKTKDLEVIAQMKALTRSYDAGHERQCRGYIGLGHHITPQLWPKVVLCQKTWRLALIEPSEQGEIDLASYCCRDHLEPFEPGTCLIEIELEPLRTGSLIYMARDRPNKTVEYVFEHDEAWFQSGLEVLAKQRAFFENNELPEHPFGGKEWSKLPCAWCDHKRETCKPDVKAGVTKLTESSGVEWARKVYGGYDAEQIINSTLERWSGRTGMAGRVGKDSIGHRSHAHTTTGG